MNRFCKNIFYIVTTMVLCLGVGGCNSGEVTTGIIGGAAIGAITTLGVQKVFFKNGATKNILTTLSQNNNGNKTISSENDLIGATKSDIESILGAPFEEKPTYYIYRFESEGGGDIAELKIKFKFYRKKGYSTVCGCEQRMVQSDGPGMRRYVFEKGNTDDNDDFPRKKNKNRNKY